MEVGRAQQQPMMAPMGAHSACSQPHRTVPPPYPIPGCGCAPPATARPPPGLSAPPSAAGRGDHPSAATRPQSRRRRTRSSPWRAARRALAWVFKNAWAWAAERQGGTSGIQAGDAGLLCILRAERRVPDPSQAGGGGKRRRTWAGVRCLSRPPHSIPGAARRRRSAMGGPASRARAGVAKVQVRGEGLGGSVLFAGRASRCCKQPGLARCAEATEHVLAHVLHCRTPWRSPATPGSQGCRVQAVCERPGPPAGGCSAKMTPQRATSRVRWAHLEREGACPPASLLLQQIASPAV